jgi:hypothetical protein
MQRLRRFGLEERMKDFLDSDKHIIAFVLLVFLIVWVITRDDVVTRMMDTVLGALITLITQKLANKEK